MAATILLIHHAAHDDVGRLLCGRMPGIALGATGHTRIAVVSHGDVIMAALMAVLGLSLDAWPRFDIDPASVSRLQFGPAGRKVLSMNENLCP